MRRTHKRFGSLLLVLAMLLMLLPVSAMAAETQNGMEATPWKVASTEEWNAAVSSGGFVQLSEDFVTDTTLEVPTGKTVVLDLNGKKIESTCDGYTLVNNGTLIINDVSGEGIICNTSTGEANGCTHFILRNYSDLTVNGGTFGDTDTDRTNANSANWGAALINLEGGNCVINGGYFTCGDNYWAGKPASASGSNANYSYAIRQLGNDMKINGGTVYGAMNGGIAADSGQVTITDGTVSVTGAKSYACLAAAQGNGSFVVTGGTFIKSGNTNAILNNFSGMPSWDASDDLLSNGYDISGGTFIVNGQEVDMIQTAIAQVGNQKYSTLEKAVEDAQVSGETVVLLRNVSGQGNITLTSGKSVVVDLNGFDIGFAQNQRFAVKGGSLHITGEGKVYEQMPYYAPIVIVGSDEPVENYSVVTVDQNVTLEGWAGIFIGVTDTNNSHAYGVNVIMDGTINSVRDREGYGGHGVYINGLNKDMTGPYPRITLGENSKITSVGNGIYAAGFAEWNLAGNITAGDALSIKSGIFHITDGTYHSTGEFMDPADANNNGSENTGAALSITSNQGYAQKIDITVTGGTFISDNGYALYEGIAVNEDNKPAAPESYAVLSVSGGQFQGNEDTGDISINTAEDKRAISGGHFAQPVNPDYLDNSLNAELKSASNPEAPYSYYTSMSDAIAAAKPGDVVTPIQTGSTATTYTVTLDYNDGRTGNVTCTVEENASISLPRPTRSGYDFLGWYAGGTKVSSPYKVTGNVALVAQWSYIDQGGGTTEPSGEYLVNVDRTTGGKVTVNPGRADKGDTVTITVKPNDGYVLDELTVTAKDGGSVKLTWKDDNKYTFTMPGSQVTVEATFVKEGGEQPVVTLPFTDVAESDWYYDAVEYVYENDLMNGTSATTFSPFVTTSRAMILTILARYDGVDTSTGSTWYEAGAAWAIAEGVSDGTNLEANLTREQLVTMLWRYAGSPVVESDLSDYPDSASVSDWAVNAMIWAVENGVITGNGAGALNPQGTATRAEVATILMRFIEK